MKDKTVLLVFKTNNSIFAIPVIQNVKIIKIEKKEFVKLTNIISIKTILKTQLNFNFNSIEKIDYYNVLIFDKIKFLIPFNFYKLSIDESILDEGENLINKKFEFKGKEIIILSIKWIIKNYFINEQIESKKEIVKEKLNEEFLKTQNIDEVEMDNIDKNRPDDSNLDEEKKKEIFDQIEREIDRLKISNFNEVQKKYMKESKSFTPQLVILYSILITLAVVVFIVLSVVSGHQESRMAQDIKTIGGMESLIIRELQRKQEQERNQLNEQLKEITMQLEAIQKQKEQFEKNQILALNAKTKEIEDEYLKKMEDEKNKLNRGLISRAEYDKRIKELIAEKEKRLQDARNQSDAQRRAFQQQMEAKENELKAKENSYKQALAEKEKQIAQANEAIKVAEEKLALSEEAQKRIAQENEQLKQSSALQIKLKETIVTYYKAILVAYKNDDREKLKRALNDFYNFIFNNPSAAILAEDEKLFDKFVVDVILNELNKKESDETKKIEKFKLLEKALNEHKKGNLISSYESYYLAFVKYDVIVDNEKMYFEDFLRLVYEKQSQESTTALESLANPLFASIQSAYQSKNYSQVIQLANSFLSSYPSSKNALLVVEYKIKSEINLQSRISENMAASLYQKAKNYFNIQDYDNAVKTLLELFSKYGNTSYSTLGSELLQQIYVSVKQNSSNVAMNINEEEEVNETKIGNVFKIFPEIIQVLKDPNLATTVDIGAQLIVKHKNENGTFTTTALIEVTSYATTIINAKIIRIYGKGPNIGDYVFLIKK